MKALRVVPFVVLIAGALTVSGAVAWWALTYWQVWAYDYLPLSQAGRCLLADSTICRLAAVLCTGQHRSFVAIYSPSALWMGASALLCGAWPVMWQRARIQPRKR